MMYLRNVKKNFRYWTGEEDEKGQSD